MDDNRFKAVYKYNSLYNYYPNFIINITAVSIKDLFIINIISDLIIFFNYRSNVISDTDF